MEEMILGGERMDKSYKDRGTALLGFRRKTIRINGITPPVSVFPNNYVNRHKASKPTV